MRYSFPLDLHAIAVRYPRVPFIVPHFGAGYLREALMLADLCPNVYLDTSSSNSWMRYEGLDLRTVFRRALDTAVNGALEQIQTQSLAIVKQIVQQKNITMVLYKEAVAWGPNVVDITPDVVAQLNQKLPSVKF